MNLGWSLTLMQSSYLIVIGGECLIWLIECLFECPLWYEKKTILTFAASDTRWFLTPLYIKHLDKTLSLVSGLGSSSHPPLDVSLSCGDSSNWVDYSDLFCRNWLQILQIVVECFSALGLLIIGQVLPLKFEPVIMTADRASKAQEESLGRPDINTFNHRSRELYKRSLNKTWKSW